MSINGEDVGTFDEVNAWWREVLADVAPQSVRDNRHIDVEALVADRRKTPARHHRTGRNDWDFQPSAFLPAVIGIADPESPAYRAGLRTFDIVTGLAVSRCAAYGPRAHMLENRGETVPVTYLRPVSSQMPSAAWRRWPSSIPASFANARFRLGHGLLTAPGWNWPISTRGRPRGVLPLPCRGCAPATRCCVSMTKPCQRGRPSSSESSVLPIDRSHRTTSPPATIGGAHSGTFQIAARGIRRLDQGQIAKNNVLRVEHWVAVGTGDKVAHPAPISLCRRQSPRGNLRRHADDRVAFVR